MIVECKNCGAPLDVSAKARMTECAYCHKTNRIRSMRTVAMERPPDWEPPQQWTPPRDAKAASVPLAYGAAPAKTFKWGFAVSLIFVVLGAIAGALAFTFEATAPAREEIQSLTRGIAAGGGELGPAPAPVWNGQEPFRCEDHAVHVLEGLDVALPHRTAIEIAGHCQLTIRSSRISAWEAITVEDHGRLLVEGSTLEANEAVIAATGHAQVEVVDTTMTSAAIAITASGHSQVVLAGGRVTGAPRAIGRSGRRHVEVRDCEVHDAARHGGARTRHPMTRHPTKHPAEQPAPLPAETVAPRNVACERGCARELSGCLSLAGDDTDRHSCAKFDETCRQGCAD